MDTSGPAAQPYKLAGLRRRAASLCYELVLVTAVVFLAAAMFVALTTALDPALSRPLLRLWLIAVTGAYLTYCWTHSGQTLPMNTWRIRVVTQEGEPLGLGRAAWRYLFALTGTLLFGSGWLWALVDPQRQFLHDRLARTRLIEVARDGKLPTPG